MSDSYSREKEIDDNLTTIVQELPDMIEKCALYEMAVSLGRICDLLEKILQNMR